MSTTADIRVPTPPSILKPRKRPSPENELVLSQPLKKIQLVDSRKGAITHSVIVDRVRNVFPDHDVLSIVSCNGVMSSESGRLFPNMHIHSIVAM
jgi:hypothetical protein